MFVKGITFDPTMNRKHLYASANRKIKLLFGFAKVRLTDACGCIQMLADACASKGYRLTVIGYSNCMKPLTPYRQAQNLCGPASLKVLLAYYDRQHSEDDLAKMCKSTPEIGTTHAQLITGIKSLGAEVDARDKATIDDLRKYVEDDVPVIVGWWCEDEPHYSVVYEVGKSRIFMMDPQTESGIRIMPLEDFEKVWHDMEGGKEKVERWMLAITNWKAPRTS